MYALSRRSAQVQMNIAHVLGIPSEVACQAVALCEGLEESRGTAFS